MPLFATAAITGPNGEQVDKDGRIPAAWPMDSEFMAELIQFKFVEDRPDPDQPAPLAATAPTVETGAQRAERMGNRPPSSDPYAHLASVEVGGVGTRDNEGTV